MSEELCCLCDKTATWECETCGEQYCETHWHMTSKGKNVECSTCEKNRLEKEK